MSTYPNVIAAKDARIAELEAEVEQLKLSCSAWEDSARINKARADDAEALSRTGAVKVKALDDLVQVAFDAYIQIAGECPVEPAMEAVITAVLSALEPAAQEGWQEAGRIGDAVLDWMVKFDLLDAGNEYYVSDVLAVLNDLTPSTRPSEQAVTEAQEPFLWQCKDFADGWIDYFNEAEALAYQRDTGCALRITYRPSRALKGAKP